MSKSRPFNCCSFKVGYIVGLFWAKIVDLVFCRMFVIEECGNFFDGIAIPGPDTRGRKAREKSWSNETFFFLMLVRFGGLFFDHHWWSIFQSVFHTITYYKFPVGPLRAVSIFFLCWSNCIICSSSYLVYVTCKIRR